MNPQAATPQAAPKAHLQADRQAEPSAVPLSPRRHFLDLSQLTAAELTALLAAAARLKTAPHSRQDWAGKTLALIFEKPSTRTRVSFEVGVRQLGGAPVMLTGHEMQLGTGETLGDTARVLSRYVDAVMLRTREESRLKEFVAGSAVPVINGLTNESHPCQVLADLQTVIERKGRIEGLKICWLGDGDNNVLTSWIHAACLLSFELVIACPPALQPRESLLSAARKLNANLSLSSDPNAATDADVLITDTWVSMHQTDTAGRRALLEAYQVNEARLRLARPEAIFLHCLPAHRGEEVTDAVIDSPQSAAWDAAENRLHAQKAVLLWVLGKQDRE